MGRDTRKKYELELRSAVLADDAEKLHRLARDGGDLHVVDIIKRTLLHNAAANNSIKAAKVLIALGLDIDAKNVSGETPLFTAIRQGHTEMAITLLMLGARTDIANVHGYKPLGKHDTSAITRETAAKVLEQLSLIGTTRLHKAAAATKRRRHPAPGMRP